jgi:hypothetical protein
LRHQEQREDHREHREEDDGQHDVQDRHPGHRLLRDRIVGVACLNVGAGLREGVDRRRARPPAMLLRACMKALIAVFCRMESV